MQKAKKNLPRIVDDLWMFADPRLGFPEGYSGRVFLGGIGLD